MVLTGVSDAWAQDWACARARHSAIGTGCLPIAGSQEFGSRARQWSVGMGCTRCRPLDDRGRARFVGPAFLEGRRKAPKACAFGDGGRNHPWAVAGTWPSVEPVAASAVAPDPCRGWGRNSSAHIRAQREPVVSPAGTGTDYRRPEGSPDDSHHAGSGKPSGDPSRWTQRRRSWEPRRCDSRSKGLLVPRAVGHGGTRTPLQKVTRAGESRGVRGRWAMPPVERLARRGVRGASGRLGCAVRRLRGALRLPPVADSMAIVPLQSG